MADERGQRGADRRDRRTGPDDAAADACVSAGSSRRAQHLAIGVQLLSTLTLRFKGPVSRINFMIAVVINQLLTVCGLKRERERERERREKEMVNQMERQGKKEKKSFSELCSPGVHKLRLFFASLLLVLFCVIYSQKREAGKEKELLCREEEE